MPDIIQLMIVGAAIAVAAFVALRGLWRAIRRRGACASCPEASSCKLRQVMDKPNCDRHTDGRNGCCH